MNNFDDVVKANIGFFKNSTIIDNENVNIYTYHFADFQTFKQYNAYELRGLAVTKDRIWYSVPKFFNAGQVEDTLYDNIKNLKVDKVYEKLDGSLIHFIKINNKVYAKSKTSFTSDQAKAAQHLYETDEKLKNFVDTYIDQYNLLFEYVSFNNKIVVDYDCDELRLIMARDLNGKFVDIDFFNYKKAKYYDYSLDYVINYCHETKDNIEGFVVHFTNGLMVKVKTTEYLRLHRLLTNDASFEEIVQMVLDETVDDYISNFTGAKYNSIADIVTKVHKKYHELQLKLNNIDYNTDRKDLALKYKQDPDFNCIMKCYSTGITEQNIKNHIQLLANKNKEL